MKLLRNLLSAFVFSFLLMSCFDEVDLGYPESVLFSKDGGIETITGKVAFTHAEIHNYKNGDDGVFEEREGNVECNVYGWLKVEYQAHSNELKILAEPNETGKTRTLHVELISGYEYQTVTVTQNK